MADGPIVIEVAGRAVTIVTSARSVRAVRVRTVSEFSIGRLLKLALCWLGVPLGPLIAMTSTPDGLGREIGFAWFLAGLAMLALNAAGIVTLRARRRVPLDDGDGR
jgi:hypothetical protein